MSNSYDPMETFYDPTPIRESALLQKPLIDGGCHFIEFPRFNGEIDKDHIANMAYRGAGVGLMVVSKDKDDKLESIEAFNYVSLDKNNCVTIKRKAIKEMLEEAWKRGHYVFVGTCSCYDFCDPTLLHVPSAALSIKMFGKINSQAIREIQETIEYHCSTSGFTLFQ